MSYFAGWFEGVVSANAKLDLLMQEHDHFMRLIMAAIELEEFRIGENFDSELIKRKLNELNNGLNFAQLKINNRISAAFDKHFERNKDKEANKCHVHE